MKRIIWLPRAKADIQRLFDFLVDLNPEAAERVVRLIQTGAARLRETPEIGRPMQDETGRRELLLPFGVSAYVLRYRLSGDDVVIIRVWHGREDRE